MPESNRAVMRQLRDMPTEELTRFISSQREIEKRCSNPNPRNATLHRNYTQWALDELKRREALEAA